MGSDGRESRSTDGKAQAGRDSLGNVPQRKETKPSKTGLKALQDMSDAGLTIVPHALRSSLYTSPKDAQNGAKRKRLAECISRGRPHHVFDVALPRGKLSGSGLVRECSISATAYASDVPAFSRTSPLPQNPVSSVGYRLFDKRRLAGDGVCSVTDRSLQKKHRRQAASHGSPWLQQDLGAWAYRRA